jgi:hypothetical protein
MFQIALDSNNVVVSYYLSDIKQPGSVVVEKDIYEQAKNKLSACQYIDGKLIDYIPPPVTPVVTIPDNPTLGDWRVGLALWVRDDNNDHPITWLDYLTSVVKQLVDSGHPLGQVIVQRLEYSNNVKRVELLQLKEFFQFSEDQVNESLRRAYIVSLGDLNRYATIPSKYL